MVPVVVLLSQVPVHNALLALLVVVLWHANHALVENIVDNLDASLFLYDSVEVLLTGNLDQEKDLFRYQFAINVHLVILCFILP